MIYVNGDSWSFGMYDKNNIQQPVWPDLVAKELKHELYNDSIGCASNSRILSSTENFYIRGSKPQLIILALTGHNRIHIPGPSMSHWNISTRFILNDSTGSHDLEQNEKTICNWIVKNSYDELDSIYRYYRTVWNLHNLCQKFKCMYIMFQAWDEELQSFKLLDDSTSIEDFVHIKAGKELRKDVFDNYINGLKFLRQESKNWNIIDPTFRTVLSADDYDNTGHPNQNGHRLISQFVLQYITNQNLRKWL